MRTPVLRVHLDGLIVDNFCGGGGASTGIEWATGRSPDIAINHDAEAIAMHEANHPEEYVIADIGMRMLAPHELAAAQGFPASYQLAPIVNGKPLSRTAQIRMIGNSVSPYAAAAILRENLAERRESRQAEQLRLGVAACRAFRGLDEDWR